MSAALAMSPLKLSFFLSRPKSPALAVSLVKTVRGRYPWYSRCRRSRPRFLSRPMSAALALSQPVSRGFNSEPKIRDAGDVAAEVDVFSQPRSQHRLALFVASRKPSASDLKRSCYCICRFNRGGRSQPCWMKLLTSFTHLDNLTVFYHQL